MEGSLGSVHCGYVLGGGRCKVRAARVGVGVEEGVRAEAKGRRETELQQTHAGDAMGTE